MDQSLADRIAWIEHWKKAGLLLDQQAQLELRQMSLQQRQQQIRNLLDLAWKFRKARTDSGLVELRHQLIQVFGS
jgi:hypothetical protein